MSENMRISLYEPKNTRELFLRAYGTTKGPKTKIELGTQPLFRAVY